MRGGDRLPWVPLDGAADNFTPLASLDWQLHVYGDATPELAEACRRRRLALHVFPWRGAMRGPVSGDTRVPDSSRTATSGSPIPGADAATLQTYLDERGLR